MRGCLALDRPEQGVAAYRKLERAMMSHRGSEAPRRPRRAVPGTSRANSLIARGAICTQSVIAGAIGCPGHVAETIPNRALAPAHSREAGAAGTRGNARRFLLERARPQTRVRPEDAPAPAGPPEVSRRPCGSQAVRCPCRPDALARQEGSSRRSGPSRSSCIVCVGSWANPQRCFTATAASRSIRVTYGATRRHSRSCSTSAPFPIANPKDCRLTARALALYRGEFLAGEDRQAMGPSAA